MNTKFTTDERVFVVAQNISSNCQKFSPVEFFLDSSEGFLEDDYGQNSFSRTDFLLRNDDPKVKLCVN